MDGYDDARKPGRNAPDPQPIQTCTTHSEETRIRMRREGGSVESRINNHCPSQYTKEMKMLGWQKMLITPSIGAVHPGMFYQTRIRWTGIGWIG